MLLNPSGRLVAVNTYNGTDHNNLGNIDNAVSYRYADKTNYLSGITHNSSVLGTSKLDFTYGNLANGQMPDQIYSVKWNDVSKKNYTYDGLGRVTSQTVYPSVGVSLDNTYTYKDVGENNTSTQVSRVTNALGTYDYEYDANGNITKITFTALSGSSGSYVREYQYDQLNRITYTSDTRFGYRHEYEYDTNGNIISRNRYADYHNNGTEPDRIYTYDYDDTVWTDLITAFCGNEITYDEIGNPLNYYNSTSFTWQNGRQLASLTFLDKTTTYAYDADGKRTSKTVDGVTTEFFYAGDILAGQKTGDNILMWIYDNNGAYIGFTYNGVEYYYVYNLQGDVEAITDATGTIVASYTYGAWGSSISVKNHTTNGVNIAQINPIRYRGYYYDAETNFYYLNSRYYDPGICRFINADGAVSGVGGDIQGYNMFAYCFNNPVRFSDLNGTSQQFSGGRKTQGNNAFFGFMVKSYENVINRKTLALKNSQTNIVMYTGGISDSYSGRVKFKIKFRDVTEEVNRALLPYVQLGQSIATLANAMPLYEPYRYGTFGMLVYHGSTWDIKRKGPWESTIGTKFPGTRTPVLYQGRIVTPEKLGNYTYGLLGASFGISFENLINGSVFAALIGGTLNSPAGIDNEIGDWNEVARGYFFGYKF